MWILEKMEVIRVGGWWLPGAEEEVGEMAKLVKFTNFQGDDE